MKVGVEGEAVGLVMKMGLESMEKMGVLGRVIRRGVLGTVGRGVGGGEEVRARDCCWIFLFIRANL